MSTIARSSTHNVGFLLRWLLASSAGVVIGMALLLAASIMLEGFVAQLPGTSGDWVFGLVVGCSFGSCLGVAQWLVLRRFLAGTAIWIPATMAAFVFACLIIFGLLNGGDDTTSLLTKLGHALVLGGSLGIAQARAVRSALPGAGRWVVVSLISWTVAELAGIAATGLLGAPWNFLILFLVGGFLPGLGLVLISRQVRLER